jgi:hypothetical protein
MKNCGFGKFVINPTFAKNLNGAGYIKNGKPDSLNN